MNAGKEIYIKSGAGNIDASCLNDIRIQSTEGSVSRNYFFFHFFDNNLISIYLNLIKVNANGILSGIGLI